MLRDHSCVKVLDDKTRMMSNPVTQQKGFVNYNTKPTKLILLDSLLQVRLTSNTMSYGGSQKV